MRCQEKELAVIIFKHACYRYFAPIHPRIINGYLSAYIDPVIFTKASRYQNTFVRELKRLPAVNVSQRIITIQ